MTYSKHDLLTCSPGINAGDSLTLASESSCFMSASHPWFHAGLVLRRFHRQPHRKPCGGKTQPFGQHRLSRIDIPIVMDAALRTDPVTNLQVQALKHTAAARAHLRGRKPAINLGQRMSSGVPIFANVRVPTLQVKAEAV